MVAGVRECWGGGPGLIPLSPSSFSAVPLAAPWVLVVGFAVSAVVLRVTW